MKLVLFFSRAYIRLFSNSERVSVLGQFYPINLTKLETEVLSSTVSRFLGNVNDYNKFASQRI